MGQNCAGILFIMVGPPGVGKSTVAGALAREHNAVRIEVDSYREKVFGGMNMACGEQSGCFIGPAAGLNTHIHALAMGSCIPHLEAGGNVVYDGTNTNPEKRALLAQSLRQFAREIVLVLVSAPLPVCVARNAQRCGDRRVPEQVVRTKWQEVRAHPPTAQENHVDRLLVIDNAINTL